MVEAAVVQSRDQGHVEDRCSSGKLLENFHFPSTLSLLVCRLATTQQGLSGIKVESNWE